MATAKMYAWTNIKTADGVVKAGEAVTASSLGVDEDEWNQLCDSKVVREAKFPDMPADYTGSPLQFIQEDLQKQLAAAEDALSEDDAMVSALNEAEGAVE
jgi:hypothetical protein